ncbi:helix-turn-helix domain-containing protein [Neobittarella massiliensis]|uniref:helix-turn-helix domain-containing protein n=1 Tax=Neobittarella massiliensis (ex Bilen et al. 2018) TaxID=2041842 RepID=UPI000CF70F3C|nr:helix-turn-helix transcriptional regulator [Neobittarella massiliensis]
MNFDLGKHIKKLRASKHMTQAQLSDKAGISVMSLRRYENGDRKPSIDILRKIAAALGTNHLELLGLTVGAPIEINTSNDNDFEKMSPDNIRDSYGRIADRVIRAAVNTGGSINDDTVEAMLILQDGIEGAASFANHKLLEHYYGQLNAEGQKKAVERIQELTEVPKYRKDNPDNEDI